MTKGRQRCESPVAGRARRNERQRKGIRLIVTLFGLPSLGMAASTGVDDNVSGAALPPFCPSCGLQVGPIEFCAAHNPLRPEPRRVRRALAGGKGWRRLTLAYRRRGWPETTPENMTALWDAMLAEGAELAHATTRALGMGTRVPAGPSAVEHDPRPPPTTLRSGSLISAQGPPVAPPLASVEAAA